MWRVIFLFIVPAFSSQQFYDNTVPGQELFDEPTQIISVSDDLVEEVEMEEPEEKDSYDYKRWPFALIKKEY